MSASQDHAPVIAPPALVTVVIAAAGVLLHRLWPITWLPRSLSRALGLPLLVVSGIPAISALLFMRRARTSSMPYTTTNALVTKGPFGYSRNPIYVTFVLVPAALAVFFNSLWMALTLPVLVVVLNKGVIEREEAYLARRFGDAYRQYCAHVPRWL